MITSDFSRSIRMGEPVPGFDLPSATGGNVRFASFYCPRVVFFTCNHCPYVVGWEGRVHELARRYAGRVQFIGINANDATRYPDDSFARMQDRARAGNPAGIRRGHHHRVGLGQACGHRVVEPAHELVVRGGRQF